MFNKYLKKTSIIYITEPQTAAILIDYSTKTMFTEHLKKAFIINTAESWTTVSSTIYTTIIIMNKASDKTCSINYLKL